MFRNSTDSIDDVYPIGFTFCYVITAFILQFIALVVANTVIITIVDFQVHNWTRIIKVKLNFIFFSNSYYNITKKSIGIKILKHIKAYIGQGS